jgi:hypothetical protein
MPVSNTLSSVHDLDPTNEKKKQYLTTIEKDDEASLLRDSYIRKFQYVNITYTHQPPKKLNHTYSRNQYYIFTIPLQTAPSLHVGEKTVGQLVAILVIAVVLLLFNPHLCSVSICSVV